MSYENGCAGLGCAVGRQFYVLELLEGGDEDSVANAVELLGHVSLGSLASCITVGLWTWLYVLCKETQKSFLKVEMYIQLLEVTAQRFTCKTLIG